MRFKVTFSRGHAREAVIEAAELREASEIVKINFPDHHGYSLEPVN
jgi:hypothetical protein